MSGPQSIRVREILAEVMSRPESERSGFLVEACRDDVALMAEVEALVGGLEWEEHFLAAPTRANADSPVPAVSAAAPSPLDLGAATDVALADQSEAPGTRIGRYKLLQKIGEGGFGTVFMAEQQHPVHRVVALKIIKLGMDTKQVIARFEAERQVLSMMDHPNIARVLDAGATDSGRPYFVMDLIRGIPVTEYGDANKLSVRQRLELFVQVCQAVQHAHSKGVIHRDLKPTNVLVTMADGVPVPKVIDFGIAKATSIRLTEMTLFTEYGQLVGTPEYMSPEQAEMSAIDVDTRSDIYALGVLLYELLTGTTPFDARELRARGYAEIQRVVREVEPRRPSTRLSTMGAAADAVAARRGTDSRRLTRLMKGELDWIVLRALEKDRTRRYQTANGLAMDVQRYLSGEPVLARPPSTLYRFGKLASRNKLAVGGGAAFVLTLIIGLVTSIWLLVRETEARNRAVIAEGHALVAQGAEKAQRDEARLQAYASDMNLVQQALALNNLGRARELLDRHRPRLGEKDLRGWEWRYLWEQCRNDALMMVCRQPRSVDSLAVSHDGRWLAVGEWDGGGLSIWDLHTRQKVGQPPAGNGAVWAAFSPREPLLAFSGSFKNEQAQWTQHLRLWNPNTGSVRADLQLDGWCIGLAFSGDGQSLLTSTWGPKGQLTVWHVADATKQRSIPAPQTSWGPPVTGIPFAAAADLSAAAVAPDGAYGVIDLITGKQRWSNRDPVGTVTSMTFSPDGRIMAISHGTSMGLAESAIHLLDAATGKPLGPPLEGHLAWVGALVFWPDGKTLASASADQTIRLWDVSDPSHGKPIGRPLRGNTQEVWRLAMLPDNKTLVSGAKDGSAYLWDASQAREDRGHVSFPTVAWAFQERGASLLSIDADGRVVRRDGSDLQRTFPVIELGEKVDGASFCLRGRLLLVHCDSKLAVWDLETKKRLMTRPIFEGNVGYCGTTCSSDHCLTYIQDDDTVHEWNVRTGAELRSWHTQGRGLSVVTTTPNGRQRVTLAYGGTGLLMDLASGRNTPLALAAHWVDDACFSPDGKLLAVTGDMGSVQLWNTVDVAAGGSPPACASLTGFMLGVHSVTFTPDGRRLAAGDGGIEAIKLWDITSRQELLNLPAHGLLFNRTEFSPDGTLLASSNQEGELHLWRAPTLAEIDATEASETGR